MMKITSSTSITSISGTMLISAIGAPPWRGSKLAKAMARSSGCRRPRGERTDVGGAAVAGARAERLAHRDEGVQLVGEGVELGREDAVGARQPVVADHRRDRDRQAEAGHDQRLADRAGDLVERS